MKRIPLFLLCIASAAAEPPGIEQSMEFVTPPIGGQFIRWYGKPGRSYFVQVSDPADHLTKWNWAPIIESGNDEDISYEVEGTADKGFFRLKYADIVPGPNETLETADFDGDGISNIDEISPPQTAMTMCGPLPPSVANATDPLNPDTDGDGLPDGWEIAHGLNPNDSADAANIFPGSSLTNLQAFNAGVQGNPNATVDDKDGDGVENINDAAPDDGNIDWKRTADPQFAVIELPAADPDTLTFNDVSPNGTVLFERSDNTRLVISRNFVASTLSTHMNPPVGEFGGAWHTLIGDKVLGRKTIEEYQTGNYLWDPIDNTYTSYATDRYYDFIHDSREGFLVKQSRYGDNPGLGTHLGQLMGCSDFGDARIEGNGNIVASNEYWRYDSNAATYGAAISFSETTVARSATLVQTEPNPQGNGEVTRTWNLVPSSTGLHVSKDNAPFVKSQLELGASRFPIGVTSQGWVATNNEIWSNGSWSPLEGLLGGATPQQATLLGILDTGLGVARIQYETGPAKIVLLVPMETVVGDARDIENAHEGFTAAEATPAPSVEMTVTSSTLQGGDLHIRLQGTVIDSVSRFAQTATERPQALNFYHQDELLHSIPLDETVGDGFEFDETVVVTNALPETYVIHAETTENIAGAKGYDESSISLTWEEDASAFPELSAPLSIAFAAAPSNTIVDQATLFIGNNAPQAGDTASVETAVDSLTFTGNLLIPAQPTAITAPCQLELSYLPTFSTTEPDSIVVNIEFTAPGFPKNHIYGRWVETGANTLVFSPGDWVFGNQVLKTSQTSNRELGGSPPSDIEACTIRFHSLPPSLPGGGLQVVCGATAYDLINKNGTWYPEDPDLPGEIKRFMPSAFSVPARLQAPGYDPQTGLLKFHLRYPGMSDFEASDVLIVPGEENPESPVAATGNAPTAGRTYSLQDASSETPPPWQPGNPVIPEHVIWAYRFLNADDTFAIELLDGYLRGGHKIETGDVAGDLDLDVALGNLLTDDDNIWTIQIEEDINPVLAARLLFEGLKQASPYKEVFDHYAFEDPMDEILAFKAAMETAVQKTQETAIAATEIYLSGLGVVNEGLDWIIIVNDVSEGHYESLAAALPFIPAGLVKTGGFLKLKKLSGEITDSLDTAQVATLKEVATTRKLATIGTVLDDEGYSLFLRKVVTSDSGPITIPTRRATLKDRMAAISPRPGGALGWMKYEAHHDLPWEMRSWFAKHGIDVNDAAFGRWANKTDHKAWHQGDGRGGAFNAWWKKVEADELDDIANGGTPLTKLEIVEKLEECRGIFFQTQ